MADPQQTIVQIAATHAAATTSSDKAQDVLNDEITKPISDPAVMASCAEIVAENSKTIQKCDQNLVATILARADVDTWLSTLGDLTTNMSAQTEELTDDLAVLNTMKSVATAIAGMLVLLA